jgi:hypothetical protein
MEASEKTPTPQTTAPRAKPFSKPTRILASVVGLACAVVGLVGMMTGSLDIVDVLLVVGGLLLGVVGLISLRRARLG